MLIIIDTNRIIASLIKDGVARSLLFNSNFEFITPEITLNEITKYEEEICEKAHLSHDNFLATLSIIMEKIRVISKEKYEELIPKALSLISDSKDAPFIALALSYNAEGIWSEDLHFGEQNIIQIYNNTELKRLI